MITKNIIILGICWLLVLSFTINGASSDTISNATIFVDIEGGADYTKIQDAIDNSSDGDTIIVENGTYFENILIDKDINLYGRNQENCIIDGSEISDVIKIVIGGSDCHVDSFTITNSGEFNHGVILAAENTNISNCIISNNYHGIKFESIVNRGNIVYNSRIVNNNWNGIIIFDYAKDNTIKYSTISGNAQGVFIIEASKNKIINNNIEFNSKTGVTLQGYSCFQNSIRFNVIQENEGYGIQLFNCGTHNEIISNDFINNGNNRSPRSHYNAKVYNCKHANWNGNYWEPRRIPFINEQDWRIFNYIIPTLIGDPRTPTIRFYSPFPHIDNAPNTDPNN